MDYFTLELKLKTNEYDKFLLYKKFERITQIYNIIINEINDVFIRKSSIIKGNNCLHLLTDQKLLINKLEVEIAEYCIKNNNGKSITLIQRLIKKIWKNINENIKIKKEIPIKKYGTLKTIESINNKCGICIVNNKIFLDEIVLSFNIKTEYEKRCFKSQICYSRILRKFVKNKYNYYLQIVFYGNIPLKNNRTNNVGRVGIDLGTKTIACVSHKTAEIINLYDNSLDNEISRINSKLDKLLLRIQNHIEIKDSIYKQIKNLRNRLRDLYRKQKDIKKYFQHKISNHILSLGNIFFVEKMDYKKIQQSSIVIKKENYQKKYGFGKSINHSAPASIMTLMDYKAFRMNKKIMYVETEKVKASQFNHVTLEYIKSPLSEKWKKIGNHIVQRDLYSAFLLMNVNNDLKSINSKQCEKNYDKFIDNINKNERLETGALNANIIMNEIK